MKAFVIDVNKCNGCYNCQIACKDEHVGNDWSPIAQPQPMTGQYWCKVNEEERGRTPVVRVLYTPVMCAHCSDAPCVAAAKDNAVYRREDGLIIIDPEKAKGQKEIVDACPVGAIFWNDELNVAQKCTGCAHLLDNGWEVPRCVDACSTGALKFGNEEDFDLSNASVPEGLEEMGAHVYYVDKPKRWIAGTVADRTINEVIIGADVDIVNADSNEAVTIKTDEFGDFRYYECENTQYKVSIKAEGYKQVDLDADCSEKDVVFDDVLVVKA